MTKLIRKLHAHDQHLVKAMETGIHDDYVVRSFSNLIERDFLYGCFVEDQLVSIGGYSVYADYYAMLGRLRSDRRFRGQDNATELLLHILKEIMQNKQIKWVGANTQENNISARRVLEKLGLPPIITLHGATTETTAQFETGAKPWNLISNLSRKKEWLKQMFIEPKAVFPYECYYPFPATKRLFCDDEVKQWHFYENYAQTRLLITKSDQKKHHYLHVIYPWNDFMQQKGLWETIAMEYSELKQHYHRDNEETYIWIDLTKEEVHSLPSHHPFELDSPWILHGINKDEWKDKRKN